MKIECIIRRDNGTTVTMGDKTYHFAPSANDERHIADVFDKAHAARFLSITEGFAIVTENPSAVPVKEEEEDNKTLGVRCMSKDELELLALERFGVNLDKRKRREDLIKQVLELLEGED